MLAVVFAESGLLIGFFLPGDSLLFTTGLLVADHDYLSQPLWLVCTLIVLSAVAGDQAGYLFGREAGPALFRRPDSKLFKRENVDKAHASFERYGPRSIVLARFVPVVPTFTPRTPSSSSPLRRSPKPSRSPLPGACLAGSWSPPPCSARSHPPNAECCSPMNAPTSPTVTLASAPPRPWPPPPTLCSPPCAMPSPSSSNAGRTSTPPMPWATGTPRPALWPARPSPPNGPAAPAP
ncbi:MAG: hypothetical protein HOY76_08815, partial [Streptomyces sp.]|nr:hypothetical protein [Streptomyces sp.]